MTYRKLALVLLTCCCFQLATAQTNNQRPAEPDKQTVEWIAAHAVRLKTPEAGHGFDDMQPLKKIVGNARIVSLGEATHGTREFFQLKHRMLEFLASEMGFTIFSIEANMPEAYRLNDYVLNGNGDPAKLLKGMYFWTWDTQEVLEMIRWMREFNKSGKGHVQFTGFDMQTPDVAMEIVRDFVAKNDPSFMGDLQQASAKAKATSPQGDGPRFAVATASFPIQVAAGKRIRYSGYIKTQDISRGWAGLWWRVDGKSGVLAFDNMNNRGATGTTDWKRYEIELPVAADVTNINFGAIQTGDGSAWFDGLTITVDGQPYSDQSKFDLDFESSSPVGFHTGGNGYQVTLATDVFQSGKQSLRMKYVGEPANASAVDPKEAGKAWQAVMRHLEESRGAYTQKGIADRELEWIIQNARIVVQCLQLRANEVPRDQSMAENVKWIADHNPNAKIVLWAHNGHVSTAATVGYKPMGATLREMFAEKMVVFGFAFNQGSFQAIEQGKGGLTDFTVPPAAADSLDATLAATGIPLFALDLRRIPTNGPVAAWFNQPHKSRSIGAVYSSDSDYRYQADLNAPKSFDALLFVEKTTAARKNPPSNTAQTNSSQKFLARTVFTERERTFTTPEAFHKSLNLARAPGGMAIVYGCPGDGPARKWNPQGQPLDQVLNDLIAADKSYTWEVHDEAVNLLPARGEPLLLQTHINEFTIRTKSSLDALNQLQQRAEMKEAMSKLQLNGGLAIIMYGPSPTEFLIQFKGGTLRQALNTIAVSHGTDIWDYRETHCGDKNEVMIRF